MSSQRGSRYERDETPWRDEAVLCELYIQQGRSTIEIAEQFDCTTKTISNWLKRHGIEARDQTHGLPSGAGSGRDHPNWQDYMSHRTHPNGYDVWSNNKHTIGVHRLAAVAWYGYEAIKDQHVHHQNGIPWDNRESNLAVVSAAEHARIHNHQEADHE